MCWRERLLWTWVAAAIVVTTAGTGAAVLERGAAMIMGYAMTGFSMLWAVVLCGAPTCDGPAIAESTVVAVMGLPVLVFAVPLGACVVGRSPVPAWTFLVAPAGLAIVGPIFLVGAAVIQSTIFCLARRRRNREREPRETGRDAADETGGMRAAHELGFVVVELPDGRVMVGRGDV